MNTSGFIVNLTHDIDFIKKTYQYITHDLFRMRISNLKRGFNSIDPFWTFDKIVRIEDNAGVRSTFFFLEESIPWKPFQAKVWNLAFGKYKFSDSDVKKLIRKLDSNNWEIGLHGSFSSYKDKELLRIEKSNLEAALGKKVIGVRQHFLNLDIPETWKLHKEIGFSYDASLGKKNDIGFYRNLYTPFRNRESDMLVIPLTIMDTYLSVINKKNISEAWSRVKQIIIEAEENNAVLSVLWHNNFFNDNDHPGFSQLYERILRECKNRGAEFMTCREVYEKFHQVIPSTIVS